MIDTAHLARIWQAHDLGTIRHVERPARGSVNTCLIVNDTLVARFATNDIKGSGRFAGEARAYQLLAGAGLPVPQVVALDQSHTLVPYDYLISTRLPGTPIIDLWPDLTAAEQAGLAYEAGQALARIHGVRVRGFGNLYAGEAGRFERWPDYVRDYLTRYTALARDLGVIDAAFEARLFTAYARVEPQLAAVTQAALLHSDYQFENLLGEGAALTGVLDFEWALAGDPVWDLIVEDKWGVMCPGSHRHVMAGYEALRPLDPHHGPRLDLYKLLMHLESAVDAARSADVAWLGRSLRAVRDLLTRLLS